MACYGTMTREKTKVLVGPKLIVNFGFDHLGRVSVKKVRKIQKEKKKNQEKLLHIISFLFRVI